jgi:hypothetical protein
MRPARPAPDACPQRGKKAGSRPQKLRGMRIASANKIIMQIIGE